ncbi:MAG TPA: hypothetical protein VFO85_02580 [Vicinamibacteria bacterium]|nr:hypothetical protein [Vicinamibacteria bacterium]
MKPRAWSWMALVLAAGCATRRPEAVPAPPLPPPPSPPAPVSMPAPPAPVSLPAPPAPPLPRPLAGGIDCPVKREWTARMLGDRGPFRAQWRECAPARGLELPRQQIAMWEPGGTEMAWGIENVSGEDRLLIERADVVDLDADGLQEVLILMRHEGTGGFMEYCLVGRKDAGVGCWPAPDLEAPSARLLQPDEDFGFHGWQVSAVKRGLRLERNIYHKGKDPNCCPTRGSVVVRLAPAGGRLRIEGVARRPPRTTPSPSGRRK